MTVKAYILITTETVLTPDVVEAKGRLPHVREVNEVIGPYDAIAEVEADEFEEITDILRQEVRSIPGIRNTLTCVVIGKGGQWKRGSF
jgi:DNA-binding Lrp family transcriptional regulator